jgi:hypothetical protein
MDNRYWFWVLVRLGVGVAINGGRIAKETGELLFGKLCVVGG